MDIENLIFQLEKKQIKLNIIEGNLKIQAPKGAISSELQKELSTYKQEILDYLKQKNNSVNHSQIEIKNEKISDIDFSLFFFSSDESINPNDKYKLVIEASKFADKNGFKGVWTPERHFYNIGGLFPNPSIIASALSTITNNLKLRAGSVVLPIHDPIRVVEDWSVIDNLSNGRVELSFASGWHVNDFVFSPENYNDRKNILFNQIDTVQSLWQGKTIKRKNGVGNSIEIQTHPRPIQKELPVWITAIGNPDTYIQAGKIGANLMTCLLDQDIDELKEKIKIYKQSLIENNFNPDDKKIALFLHTYIGTDLDQVREKVYKPFTNYLKGTLNLIGKLGADSDIALDPENMNEEDKNVLLDFAFNRYFEGRTLMGTPETCSKTIIKLKEAGVNELACLIDFGLEFEDIMAGLNQLSQFIAIKTDK